ncbi:MAG: lysophospholipid acyltransferase family protein [bacterium]|nr:lysophospholipid acyltransferase family protein [bacterium]
MDAREIRRERAAARLEERAARQAAGRNRPGLIRMRRARRRLSDFVLRTGGPLLTRMLAWTWRIERRGAAGLEQLAKPEPFVAVLWHGRLVPPLPVKGHKHRGHGVLVSPSDDGKLAGVALRAFGYRVILGSASRGGASALRELGDAVREGTPVVITPDGPRGPRHCMNSGPAWLARQTGAPMFGLAVAVDRAWRLKSWDRLVIPKPFARIVLHYCDPVRVPAETTDLELEHLTDALAANLLANERQGFADLGVPHDHDA